MPTRQRSVNVICMVMTCAAHSFLCVGYQVGVLNTALPFIAKDLHYHKDGILSSAIVLGAAAGAITAGKLADVLGPRHAQVTGCSVNMVQWGVQLLSWVVAVSWEQQQELSLQDPCRCARAKACTGAQLGAKW